MNEEAMIDVTPPEPEEGGVVEYNLLPGGLPDLPDEILFKLLTRRALLLQVRTRNADCPSDFHWKVSFYGQCQGIDVKVEHEVQIGGTYLDGAGKGESFHFSKAVGEAFRTWEFKQTNKAKMLTYEDTT